MKREAISSSDAPNPIGPYSPAIKTDSLIFCAGQTPVDPATGQLVSGGIQEQTQRVMENLRAVLTAAGSSFDSVVKTTVFLTSMSDFAAMNEVYGRYFSGAAPARTTVAVAELPRGARVEIECIALPG
ncbi:MAG TPA: RidA family protein [Ktedonobacterales bacterium]